MVFGCIVVGGEDADLLVLLLTLATEPKYEIFFKKHATKAAPAKVHNISKLRKELGV